jgi:uncharacterized protein YbaR (Trm112 family)
MKPRSLGLELTVEGDFMTIHPELLEILVCPKCKGELILNQNQEGLICHACGLMYEIRDDIPIMLIDEARTISKHDSI